MRIISWNVNGIRAVARSGALERCFEAQRPDILCLQETKWRREAGEGGPPELKEWELVLAKQGYSAVWHSAAKPGYSGVACFSRTPWVEVERGLGVDAVDQEGRVIWAEFPSFFLINAYFPNSQAGGARLEYKLFFGAQLLGLLERFQQKAPEKARLVCGDLNIAHQECDLVFPEKNHRSPGFLPEERAWLTNFFNRGYRDAFRWKYPEAIAYTWWSYRTRARERNEGWRIDSFLVNQEACAGVSDIACLSEWGGSDHCPVRLDWTEFGREKK